MKILPFNSKSLVLSGSLDNSRFGCHVEEVTLDSLENAKHGIVILGLADDQGIKNVGGRTGAKDGPQAARQKLYKFTLGSPSIPVYDLGDILPENDLATTHAGIASILDKIHALGHFPLLIGGGHDLAFPEAKSLLDSYGQIGVCNIDAHLDLRPVSQAITSGSPWFLLHEYPPFKKSKSRFVEFGIQEHCNAHSLLDYAHKNKIEIHWLKKLAPKNRLKKFQQILSSLGKCNAVQISLDIDSVTWSQAPGCSAPQVNGFSAEEVIEMSRIAGAYKKTRSFGVYELSPPLDDGRTATLVAHCIAAFIDGYSTRNQKKK